MNRRVSSGAFLMLAIYHLCFCNRDYKIPKPGRCSSDNYTVDSTQVCDLNAGSCGINRDSGLCFYQQGCADPCMSTWTRVHGRAQAGQHGPGNCSSSEYYYTVLESPWLNVTHPSCLKFFYSRGLPAALDVFLDHRDGGISTVLDRSNNAGNNSRTNEQSNVDPGVAKVIFRAYGGGGTAVVKIFKVSVDPGLCTWSGNLSLEFASVDDVKQWTSPLLSPTKSDKVDCLAFKCSRSSNLAASVQLFNENSTVNVSCISFRNEANEECGCRFYVPTAYKILIKEKTQANSTIRSDVEVIAFRQSARKRDCPLNWTLISTLNYTDITSLTVVGPSVLSQPPADTQCSIPSSSTSPVSSPPTSIASGTTLKGSSHSQDHSTSATLDRDEQGGSKAGVIGGGVAVAVILIAVAVIVVIIVLRRRRRQKKHKDNRMTATWRRKTDEDSAVLSRSSNDYTNNHASRFAPSAPQEDGDYLTIVDWETPYIHGTEADPYYLAQDPIDEGPQSPEEDDYHRIIADSFPDTALPPGPVNDDYHHINSPRNLPDAGRKYSYVNVQKKDNTFGQTSGRIVGSEGMRAVQVTPDATNGYSLAKMVPSIQRKRDGDAATSAIAHGSSSSGGGTTVSDPYSRVNNKSSANAADAPNSPTKVDQEASSGNYFILEAAPDGGQLEQTASRDGNGVEDDYNMLNRDHSQPALAKDSGKPIKLYDHVRINPGDDYSTCDDGKRTIVIDSGYDHVELRNGYDHVEI
ncbi:uncharacterized protein LOC143301422 [Babylonia areolata]|uniref:uncharacterized protein LOC143301422 n=1 Tax=Babylonia areolata TaxID=304850 RepID=UPI003FCEF676